MTSNASTGEKQMTNEREYAFDDEDTMTPMRDSDQWINTELDHSTTTIAKSEIDHAIRVLEKTLVDDIPQESWQGFECALCHGELLSIVDFDYEDLTKIRTWTVAQLMAWVNLVKRSGLSPKELLKTTSSGQGEYVGVTNFHGMFIGIEKDGYAHS